MPRGTQHFTVAESNNLMVPRLVEATATIVADDNADNDVAFNWVELPNVTLYPGDPAKLVSAVIYDPGVSLANIELFFCRGSGDDGTAPTTAQNLQDGADGSAVADITAAEGTAIVICGSCILKNGDATGLLTCGVAIKESMNLVRAPAVYSTSLYVAGMYRGEPADNSGGNTTMTLYLGFEG